MRARYDGHASAHIRETIFIFSIRNSLLRHRKPKGRRLVVDVDVVWRVELAGDIDLEVVDDGSEVLMHPINLCGHDLGESRIKHCCIVHSPSCKATAQTRRESQQDNCS